MQHKKMLTISGRTQNYVLFGKLFLNSFKSHGPIPLNTTKAGWGVGTSVKMIKDVSLP
jgi:hypothetical protein